MKKIGSLLLSVILVVFVLAACSEKEETNNKKNDLDNTELTVEEQKTATIEIAVLGEDVFTKEEGFEITNYGWDDAIPPSVEFVLISKDENITDKKKEKIKELVKNKQLVFLVGKDVSFDVAKDVFGYTIPKIKIESNLPFSFLAFGYGYDKETKKNMPLFHGTNVDHIPEQELEQFIHRTVYNYLRSIKFPDLDKNDKNIQRSSDLE